MGKSSGSQKKKRSKNSSKAKLSSKIKSRKHKSKKVRHHEVSLSSSASDDSKSIDTSLSSSSEERYRRKRDRSRTRKDVKDKSKKVHRHEVSLSSSASDDSKSIDTSLSSSSEERYRRKRVRSRTRKDLKGRKKKARRHSYSADSSEDSLYAKKKKKEKRKNKYKETREKPYKKKKIRREATVSLMSNRSLSCSPCQGGSASNDDIECEISRGRSERKEKDKRRLKGRSGTEKSSRYKAGSSSSCSSPHGESNYEGTEETYMSENKSRWLRSVITVPNEGKQSMEFCRNENKEEIVDDHDYPCRSNDSNDGSTKEKLDQNKHPLSEEKLRVEDETEDVNADFNFTEPNLRDRSCSDRSSPKAYIAGTSESMKKEMNDTSSANLSGDDLETILRQKALENLRKFRGIQCPAKASEQKNKIVSQVKQPITDKELIRGKFNVSNAAVGTKLDKQPLAENLSSPVGRRNLVACPRSSERILNMDKDTSCSAKHHLAFAPEKVIDADNPSGVVTKSTNNKTGNLELTTLGTGHGALQSGSSLKNIAVSTFPREKTMVAESIEGSGSLQATHVMSHNSNNNVKDIRGMPSAVPKPSVNQPKFKHNNLNRGQDDITDHSQSESKQPSDSHEPSTPKLPMIEADEKRNVTKSTQSSIQSINSSGRDVDESCIAATDETGNKTSSLEDNSGKLQNESNQGSQFEQKTMSMMRGGEMVQVSYKVYIPKKAPGLARRQLKR